MKIMYRGSLDVRTLGKVERGEKEREEEERE